jgi:hypothetical protein
MGNMEEDESESSSDECVSVKLNGPKENSPLPKNQGDGVPELFILRSQHFVVGR